MTNDSVGLTPQQMREEFQRRDLATFIFPDFVYRALAAWQADREAMEAAREFVEMAACADNSGQEYDPTCQECGAPNNQHTSGCRLALWLDAAQPTTATEKVAMRDGPPAREIQASPTTEGPKVVNEAGRGDAAQGEGSR